MHHPTTFAATSAPSAFAPLVALRDGVVVAIIVVQIISGLPIIGSYNPGLM